VRPAIDRIVEELPCPDADVLTEARRIVPDPAAHADCLKRIDAFSLLEQRPPRQAASCSGRLRVAALNAERLARPDAVRRFMDQARVDVILLSEADVGMARSGNVHTIRQLAGVRDEGYVFGVEFVELDLGDGEEMRRHAGERNACGLHGNAIVTAHALDRPYLIPLDESGLWFKGFDGAQRRIGGRMAIAARLRDAPSPLWLVSVHLESKTDPADRQNQIRTLLRALEQIAPGEACIIGGDCNTKALPRGEGERMLLLDEPERFEPLFTDLRRAGFGWADANRAVPTQRDGPSKTHPRPFGKLDWFFTRGASVDNPQVVPSLDPQGRPVSDHEMITLDIVL